MKKAAELGVHDAIDFFENMNNSDTENSQFQCGKKTPCMLDIPQSKIDFILNHQFNDKDSTSA